MSSSPNLIDGIGDEVIVAVGLLIGFTTIVLAWMSTRVSERHYDQFSLNTNILPNETRRVVEEQTQGTVEPGVPTNDNSQQLNNEPSIHTEPAQPDVVTSSGGSPATNADHLRQRFPAGASESTQENDSSTFPNQFSIRLKFLDETVQIVQARTTETVGEFRRRVFPVAVASRYRIIFQGQVLRDDNQTLAQCRLGPNLNSPQDFPVVHCFLSSTENNPNAPRDASSQIQQTVEELNIGHFFLPMLGSILSLLLYLCVYYTSLFTLPAMFGVAGFACFFIVLLVNHFV
uniref:Transmembrane and ubiquitin-like domain-containing protein 1 n=1 Tax=Ciona intestinalis TaxID=7719 RepID=A0A1W5BAI1_CIOIN|nr:transmembrane and ubiquitin-like domain-containing protein 1 isoform X3 [Ciona intestinalis]XP_018669418.1 transmembrane and ubiquitin-like domain-containing protein 1 isoform X3 [Ciona intestinalis]|eukprot:XP_002127576.1 transmembrane and ubiquitin-like domain-containing protein 1 isoform X3 [Ciona intestinalis]